MSERGSDIDFDFFDEPKTEEATPRLRSTRGGGPRRPRRGPQGLTPTLRLVGLVAFAILLVVLLVFWAQSCRSDSKESAYREYMDDVRQIARQSDGLGVELTQQLTTPGTKPAELLERLNGLEQRQRQGLVQARELTPPGPLRVPHGHVVDALQLRASGLGLLGDAFGKTSGRRDVQQGGALLAEQVQRLLTSDVIWEDLFRRPAVAELRRQGIGAEVPASTFLRNDDLATSRGMTPILNRIRGASTGGTPTGKHGNGLVSVRALPEGKALQTDTDQNTVTATPELAFEATIENSGESQEVQVVVRLEIRQPPRPIVRRQVVPLINAGEQATVVFRDIGRVVRFGERIPVRVRVLAVRGEKVLTNNAAEYPVVFTLPAP
ncbi:MAG: hypothetical protein H0V40_02205 [Actinobacteria bacterium]|nr:hypothetical protein [Actinomycetota bacterium]